MSAITHVNSVAELNKIFDASKGGVTVIDFHASWCGPCHMIAPIYENLSKQYSTVKFLKCDVDNARDVAALYSVSAMPTFLFFRGNTKVDMVRGANRAGLESSLRKLASPSTGGAPGTTAFSGKGNTLGGNGEQKPFNNTVKNAASGVAGIDPQVKILLGLVAAYGLFWYLS